MEQQNILSHRIAGSAALSATSLRERLTARAGGRGLHGDFDLNPEMRAKALDLLGNKKPVPAAVLVPLVNRPEGLSLLLTQRTAHLAHHAGQISFPGGRIEDEDFAADPEHAAARAALRETEEEIGLDRSRVELIGRLDEYITGTGFRIAPMVGLVTPPFSLTLDSFEVAEAFEVPLEFVFDPRNHKRCLRIDHGRERHFYAIPFGRHYIWGATAGILVHFARELGQP